MTDYIDAQEQVIICSVSRSSGDRDLVGVRDEMESCLWTEFNLICSACFGVKWMLLFAHSADIKGATPEVPHTVLRDFPATGGFLSSLSFQFSGAS